jgi:Flp pilus assembly secretin CpaC
MTSIIKRTMSARAYRKNLMAIALTAAAIACAGPATAADTLDVVLDKALVTRLPERVATIVIGNPLIADVSIQSGGLLVVTGKGYGITNMVAFDRNGAVLLEKLVRVQGPTDGVLVVYRGAERESYSCTPMCERRVTLGDTPTFFEATLGQTGSRVGQAQGGVGQSTQR